MGKPTYLFWAVVAVVVGACLWVAWQQRSNLFPAPQQQAKNIQLPTDHDVTDDSGDFVPPAVPPLDVAASTEGADTSSVTTFKEYKIIPGVTLPPVKGVSKYTPLVDNTVRAAINVWSGWAPIIAKNKGAKPGVIWKTPGGKEYKLELVLIDDPVAMRDAYAAGEVHMGWATVDMLPLFMEGFVDAQGNPRDSRIMPRVFQQIDFSCGGDGIVARDYIKTVADLRGKKIVLAKNSPSEYFVLNMLVAAGVQPSEVQFIYTSTAFEAAAAFNSDKSIAAAVSWAPDIYKLAEVPGNRMLITTAEANKLIADVPFARADFAKDHPEFLEAFACGSFDGMQDLKQQKNQLDCARWMGELYGIPASDIMSMYADAHNTNWGENAQFFLNQNNPTNFERIWKQAYLLYRQMGSITHRPVPFDKVMDATIIKKLASDPKYASQKDEYVVNIVPKSLSQLHAESEILTNTVIIHFAPNQHDPFYKETKQMSDGTKVDELYDPTIDLVLEEIGTLVGKFGGAQIVIEGHTDGSMRGYASESDVKELSDDRAQAVMNAVLTKFEDLNPKQFSAIGYGWQTPADSNDPNNHAKNRRVEVKIYPAERE